MKKLLLAATLLAASTAHSATTIIDYDDLAYQHVNTDSTFTLPMPEIKDAYLWEGSNVGRIVDLNALFSTATFTGDGDTKFQFGASNKWESNFTNPAQGAGYIAILLKQATTTLFVVFTHQVSGVYWNTLFDGGDGTDISHLTTYAEYSPPPINQVPIPAAAFMFAPALLGFLGLRRKLK